MDTIAALRTLNEVVKQGSFSAAARRMRVNRSVVSRSIEALENDLGVRLFNRTTRSFSLTEAGRLYVDGSKQILTDLDLLKNSVVETKGRLKGVLRIAAPIHYGEWQLLPVIEEFLRLNSNVEIKLELSNRRVNIIDGAFDLVVRTAPFLEDSTFVARRISMNSFVPCAAPLYCDRYGQPAVPDDLVNHACVATHQYSGHDDWIFQGGDDTLISVPIKPRLNLTVGSAQVRAIKRGLGIGLLPEYIVREGEETGELVRLLTDFQHESYPVFVIYPHRELMPIRTRSFLDLLTKMLG